MTATQRVSTYQSTQNTILNAAKEKMQFQNDQNNPSSNDMASGRGRERGERTGRRSQCQLGMYAPRDLIDILLIWKRNCHYGKISSPEKSGHVPIIVHSIRLPEVTSLYPGQNRVLGWKGSVGGGGSMARMRMFEMRILRRARGWIRQNWWWLRRKAPSSSSLLLPWKRRRSRLFVVLGKRSMFTWSSRENQIPSLKCNANAVQGKISR